MNQPAARKLAWLAGFLDDFERTFEVVPLGRHAEALAGGAGPPASRARFATPPARRPSGRMLRAGGSSQQEDAR